jgi:ENTS family enterobactin (siderophore) exporter
MRGLLLDVSPLRESRDFRLLFGARLVSLLAISVMQVAVAVQVYDLTQSSLHVAMVTGGGALGMAAGLIAGGPLADRHDRRRLILASRAAYAGSVLILLGNAALAAPLLWPVYLAALLGGLTGGISAPALMAAIPALVGRERLPAAAALGSLSVQAGQVVGPSLAGLLLAGPGLVPSFLLGTLGAALVPLLIAFVRPLPPQGPAGAGGRGFAEGFRFLAGNRLVAGLLLIDLLATLLATPFPLLPGLAVERYGLGPWEIGWLYTAPAVGALLAALSSGWTGQLRNQVRALVAMVALWGVAVAALGASPGLVPALLCLVVAGYADTSSEILRGALLQAHTPDALRGRVSSLWLMQAVLTPALGGVLAGGAAGLVGPAVTLLAGGALCVAGALYMGRWFSRTG